MAGCCEIVIVEDDERDAELMLISTAKHVANDRFVVLKDMHEAADFFFSLRGLPLTPPKLIVMALKPRSGAASELLRRLKADERTRQIPIVAWATSTAEDDIRAAYRLGISSYVAKPAESERFAAVVAEMEKYWLTLNRAPSK